MTSNIWFEFVKLGLQLTGALLVARVAVNWALDRYKSEKTWERRMCAYVDAVAAVSAMKYVVSGLHDEATSHVERTEEYKIEQNGRYRIAKRSLEDGVASAQLLLPEKTVLTLTKLHSDLERVSGNPDYVEMLDTEHGLLQKALDSLTQQGRAVLQIR